jgi:hypothetical protein
MITEAMLKQLTELRDDAYRARDCIQQVLLNQEAKKVIEHLTCQIADLDKVLAEYQPVTLMVGMSPPVAQCQNSAAAGIRPVDENC